MPTLLYVYVEFCENFGNLTSTNPDDGICKLDIHLCFDYTVYGIQCRYAVTFYLECKIFLPGWVVSARWYQNNILGFLLGRSKIYGNES